MFSSGKLDMITDGDQEWNLVDKKISQDRVTYWLAARMEAGTEI